MAGAWLEVCFFAKTERNGLFCVNLLVILEWAVYLGTVVKARHPAHTNIDSNHERVKEKEKERKEGRKRGQ